MIWNDALIYTFLIVMGGLVLLSGCKTLDPFNLIPPETPTLLHPYVEPMITSSGGGIRLILPF